MPANISKHPQTLRSTGAGRIWRSRALYLQRHTRHHSESSNGCSSHRPQSVAYWDLPFVEFSMTEKYTSPICWDISETRAIIMIWLPLRFLLEKCKTQILTNVWNDGSASGNHVTLVSGLRSLPLVTWRSLKIEYSHRLIVMLQRQLTTFVNGKLASALPLIAHAVKTLHKSICTQAVSFLL